MARIFLAIEMSDDVRAELVRARDFLERKLGDRIRVTRAEQLHLTLIFLGEIEETEIARVIEAARLGSSASPFTVTIGPPGAFPESGPPTVLWVGVRDPEGALSALVASLNTTLRRAGFQLEERLFVPHLTLARCRDGTPQARGVLAELRVTPLSLPVKALTIFRSERSREGAQHIPIEVIELGSGEGR